MKVFELLRQLSDDVGVTGTAGQPVVVRDKASGMTFTVVGTEREVHEDADGSVTHWILVEEN